MHNILTSILPPILAVRVLLLLKTAFNLLPRPLPAHQKIKSLVARMAHISSSVK
mgnify:CR=1 FL=1